MPKQEIQSNPPQSDHKQEITPTDRQPSSLMRWLVNCARRLLRESSRFNQVTEKVDSRETEYVIEDLARIGELLFKNVSDYLKACVNEPAGLYFNIMHGPGAHLVDETSKHRNSLSHSSHIELFLQEGGRFGLRKPLSNKYPILLTISRTNEGVKLAFEVELPSPIYFDFPPQIKRFKLDKNGIPMLGTSPMIFRTRRKGELVITGKFDVSNIVRRILQEEPLYDTRDLQFIGNSKSLNYTTRFQLLRSSHYFGQITQVEVPETPVNEEKFI